MSGFARPLKKRGASGPTPAGSFDRRPSFGFAQPAATADAPQPWSFLKPQWHSPSPGWGSPVQAKLVVGKVDDPLEQEADRVAEAVLRPPTAASPEARPPAPPGGSPPASPGLPPSTAARPPWVQRKSLTVSSPSDLAEREADAVAARVLPPAPATPLPMQAAPAGPSQIQRRCSACEDEEEHRGHAPEGEIQRRGEGAPSRAPGVAEAVGAVGGGGDSLPPAERRFFEARLGHDLSQVRVHADRAAAEAARALDADAFTLRNDVAFAEGRYQPGSETGRRLLAHELVHVIQQGHATPLAGAGAPPVQGGSGAARIARQAAGEMERSPAPAQVPSPSSEIPQTTASGGGLIVEDDAQTLMTGQVRKSELLSELRAASCAAADRELARAGRDTRGCPLVERWLDHYKDRPAQYLERAIRKYATGAAAARSAHDYVPLVAARMAQGVATWVATGTIPGDIPDEMKAELPGGGGVGSAIGGAFSSAAGAIGGALSAIGHLFFKEAPGGARPGADAAGLSARLGPGRPLESAARSRMEGAFGRSFDGVRIHDDSDAAGLSRDLNARAFTLGEHVAFGDGGYRPGTVIGDALLAHELAHVVQQSDSAPATEPLAESRPHDPFEADADGAAADAVAALWDHRRPEARRRARPEQRSGPRLARCSTSKKGTPPRATGAKANATATTAPPTTASPVPVPVPPEDFNFTPEDFARVTGGGRKLTMAPDSGWFPAKLQENLLKTLAFVFDPTRSPTATEGVNEMDFFHGHLVIKRDAATRAQTAKAEAQGSKVGADLRKARTATLGEDVKFEKVSPKPPYTISSGYPFVTDAKGSADEKVAAYKTVVESVEPSLGQVMEDAAKIPGAAVMYHTFEFNTPKDLAEKGQTRDPQDPRRNVITPIDTNTPAPYSTPPEMKSYEGEYTVITQFSFLVDKTGAVHVRPFDASTNFTSLELSTITGSPFEKKPGFER